MHRRPKPNRRSIIIAEILCLMIFAAFLAVLRLQSFATEAIAVYDHAHPTYLEMFISSYEEPDYPMTADSIFIQDTLWQYLAHKSALGKKSASIYEVDCIKILELHLDREMLNITVKNNPLNIESSFTISIHDPRLPHVLDSLRRIGFQPNVYYFVYIISVSPETSYQNMITLMDEFALTRKNIPFEDDRIDFRIREQGSQNYFDKMLSTIKFVHSNDAVKARQEYLDNRKFQGFQCGLRSMPLYPPPPKPSIPMIFLDYLNPFGENYLHTKRWWLYEKER